VLNGRWCAQRLRSSHSSLISVLSAWPSVLRKTLFRCFQFPLNKRLQSSRQKFQYLADTFMIGDGHWRILFFKGLEML